MWWREAALPPIVALVPIVPLALALELAHVGRPVFLLLATVVGVATYAAAAFLIVFTREERAAARELALRWLSRLGALESVAAPVRSTRRRVVSASDDLAR